MTPHQQYYETCMALVRRWAVRLPPGEADDSIRLIDHGEPPEGLNYLAWAISNAGISPTSEEVHEIRDLIDGLVEDEHMPPTFRASEGQRPDP